ncbi:hypothetical protein AMTRI_Chr09g35160 [Amborella trichopoda]
MELSDLPQDCLCEILGRTPPSTICSAAATCRRLAAAARCEATWAILLSPLSSPFLSLPLSCRLLSLSLSSPPLSLPLAPTKREIAHRLTHGVLVDGGKQLYKLSGRTGGFMAALSSSAMNITWGGDSRFWRRESSRSSWFGTVSRLLAVCWFEVRGNWTLWLPHGSYSLLWRIKVLNPHGGRLRFLSWHKPINFWLCLREGREENELILREKLAMAELSPSCYERWFEFKVGEFMVKSSDEMVRLEFGVEELDCSFWKGGLLLDCVAVRPLFCDDQICSDRPEWDFSKARGTPGVF